MKEQEGEGNLFSVSLIGAIASPFILIGGAFIAEAQYLNAPLPLAFALHLSGETMKEYWGWQNEKAKKTGCIVHAFVRAKREYFLSGVNEAAALLSLGTCMIGFAGSSDMDMLNLVGGSCMYYLSLMHADEYNRKGMRINSRERKKSFRQLFPKKYKF